MNREPALLRRTCNTAQMFMLACALTVLGVASSSAQNSPTSSAITPHEATQIATDAYIRGSLAGAVGRSAPRPHRFGGMAPPLKG